MFRFSFGISDFPVFSHFEFIKNIVW